MVSLGQKQANQMRQYLLPSKKRRLAVGPNNLVLYTKSLEHFILLDPVITHLGIYPKEVTKSEKRLCSRVFITWLLTLAKI